MPRWVAPGIGGTVDACSVTFWPEMITIPARHNMTTV
jgi:hypothetical protein